MTTTTAPKKRRRTQEERREESERKLFDALIQIIINEGIGAATCENIGTLAGYSRGLTTQRLGRRDVMFSKLIQRLKDEQLRKFQESVDEDMTRTEALMAYIDVHFEDLMNDPGYNAYFVLVAGSITDTPLLKDAIIEAHVFVRDILANLIREGIQTGEFDADLDPVLQAMTIGSYLLGVALQHRIHSGINIESLKPGAHALLPAAKPV